MVLWFDTIYYCFFVRISFYHQFQFFCIVISTKKKETIRIETFECVFFCLSFLFSLSYFTTTELLFKSQRTHNKKNGNQIEFMSNHWTHKKRKGREHFSLHTNSIDFQRHYLFYSSFTKIILFFLHEFYKNQHHNSDSSIFEKYQIPFLFDSFLCILVSMVTMSKFNCYGFDTRIWWETRKEKKKSKKEQKIDNDF